MYLHKVRYKTSLPCQIGISEGTSMHSCPGQLNVHKRRDPFQDGMLEEIKQTKHDNTQITICKSWFTLCFLSSPRLHRVRRTAGSQVIFCHDSEVVFPAWHQFSERELVVVDQVTHHAPQTVLRFAFQDRVVKISFPFLGGRRLPGDCHCIGHILVQLNRSRRLWDICQMKVNNIKDVGKAAQCRT